ncbi:MAG: hypothetical protein ACOYOB_20455 [Myxococcota bacterium]
MRALHSKIGLGAAVGVALVAIGVGHAEEPAWFKKELERNVEFILSGATAFYSEEHFSASSGAMPREFPGSVGRTPSVPACKGGKPTPNAVTATTFANPAWQALNFSSDEPIWAQYALESSGSGPTARTVLRVYFDVDCDGNESVAEFTLRVGADGTVIRDKPNVRLEPGFDDNAARPVEAEAKMSLRKIADSSIAYFAEEKISPSAGALPQAFPESTGRTPPKRPDCVAGKPTLVQPKPETFSMPTWMALNFSVDDPFVYQYEYISSGTGKSAKFTARAIGDTDCDGVEAVYEVQGSVGKDGTVKTTTKEPAAGVR